MKVKSEFNRKLKVYRKIVKDTSTHLCKELVHHVTYKSSDCS